MVLIRVVIAFTTISSRSDAKVRHKPVVHNSPVETSVVIGQMLHQRRVEEVRATIPAAIVAVAVPTTVVTVVR